jgi:hypothetical protein
MARTRDRRGGSDVGMHGIVDGSERICGFSVAAI